jgi:DNA-binding NarL/FixJ family response regulator
MTRVLLVDDHDIVRFGLAQLLDGVADIALVGSVADGAAAIDCATRCHPDVVLMDLAMTGMDGIEATRRILSVEPATHVVVFTGCDEQACILEALDAGAIGYLLKDAEPDDLLRGIRAAARGESPLGPRAATAVIAARATAPRGPGRSSELTGRELEVLVLVADGLPNKQIARSLGISERTVKGHLTSAFHRLGVSTRSQAILWAERQGLL